MATQDASQASTVRIFGRKLQYQWAVAKAEGFKFFESQAYSNNRAGNLFKAVRPGDYIAFGPNKESPGQQVFGLARVDKASITGCDPSKLSALFNLLDSTHMNLRPGLRFYMMGKTSFDYVSFDIVWDTRMLDINFSQLASYLGVQVPGQWAGLPKMAEMAFPLAENILSCLVSSSASLCHRHACSDMSTGGPAVRMASVPSTLPCLVRRRLPH